MKVLFCLLLLIASTCVNAENNVENNAENNAETFDKSPTTCANPPILQENKLEEYSQIEPSTKGANRIAYDIVGLMTLLIPEENEDLDSYFVRLAVTGLLSLLAIVLIKKNILVIK